MTARPARLDPRAQLATAVAAWGVALWAPHPATPACVAALALAVRLGRPRPVRALLAPLALALLASLVVAAAHPGRASALLLLARILAGAWVAAALLASVPRSQLLATLGWARVPPALLETLAVADRQRHALGAFAAAVRDAQRLRLGWTGPLRALGSAGALAGLTALRTVTQAEIASDALALRGARGRPAPVLQREAGWRTALFAAAATAALCACLLVPRLLPA